MFQLMKMETRKFKFWNICMKEFSEKRTLLFNIDYRKTKFNKKNHQKKWFFKLKLKLAILMDDFLKNVN